ncbi:MAG: ATP-grasp domain-containing protein [Clostridiales bacterium]|nr:ATP-grasp domain-containing protein [Clostridiales bacterium]
MKRAYILYKKADAEKNRVLISKYSSALCVAGLRPSLVILDGLSRESVLRLVSGAELIINRSREWETARFLEENGLFVSNPPILNETANDKLKTYERLKSAVPMLETHLLTPVPALPFPFVAKPAGGHGGNGVTLVKNADELALYRAAHPEKSVIQPLATELGRDMRVYVVGGKPIFAMLRESKTDFRSNYSLGGAAKPVPLSELLPDERAIVSAVTGLLPLDYAGVDIMRDHGRAILNEIEDPVGARMLYTNTGLDPAAMHVDYLISKEL